MIRSAWTFLSDQPMTVYPLDLQQVLRNGNDDVTSVVSNIDDQRVKLQKGDYLDLFFLAPDLADGYERGLLLTSQAITIGVWNQKRIL